MARKYPVPTSAIPQGKERPVRKDARVNLLPMLDLLLKHLTPALCKAVFKQHRKEERERKWTLYAVTLFWAAMIYTAFRIAQAGIAEKARVLPEQISPAKLFPKLAQAANYYCVSQITLLKVKAMNPGVELKLPRYVVVPSSSQSRLYAILARPRRTKRRRFRFCPSRRRWTSLRHIPGGPTLLQSVHEG